MAKKCYKSTVDKKFAGVCGGIAEYFDIDSTLVRLIWVVLSLAGGSGLLAYIIAAIIMPDRPDRRYDPYGNGNPYQNQNPYQGQNPYQDQNNNDPGNYKQ
ncbi:MAG: PspC domain-containing protein [Lachnospiraceae bacterium]|nr:PspC domain-containing protein [Lachnospiraceae bacterium]